MTERYPCGGVARRRFLAGAVALPALAARLTSAQEAKAVKPLPGALGVPGPFPGRVIEARNPAMIRDGKKDRGAIKATLDRGMAALVGSDDGVEAWRTFFEPGDVVGIKMNPVGTPLANTSAELMLAVIEGLEAAGVKRRDMIVFDRYREEFINAKMHEAVPDGVLWGGLTAEAEPTQLRLNWPGPDPVAGYDPDEYMEMNLVHHGSDPKDDRNLRSHLGLLVTRRVNKLVMLPVLKDHGSAGVTGALKNMSHGLVNNVARSHSTPATNACNQFIPQVVAHPIIRRKCVLQILDGVRGVYQGGPFAHAQNAHWTWDYNALFVATDPVAMDRVEWDVIDAKRKAMGLPVVGAAGRLGVGGDAEGFDIRQPQHIPLAANLGLGFSEFKSPLGRRFAIDHRIVDVG